MEKKELVFRIEKATKNTIRYEEVTDGLPPVVKNIYIQKWALGENPPERIRVTIEAL